MDVPFQKRRNALAFLSFSSGFSIVKNTET
nr:MAG TPA: hypothetical protein [Caudoviricetes sp.]